MCSHKSVIKAKEAFKKGITKNVSYRIEILKNFIKFLKENEEMITDAILEDVLKHREEARMEVIVAINHVKFLIDNVRKWACPEKPSKRIIELLDDMYVYHDPYGVVLLMCSSNVPILSLIPAAGAIAAGNCVVIKPSHNVPNFGQFLVKFLPKYLNPVCYPVIFCDPDETIRLLEERFDYIYYTGSADFGKIVHLAANRYLTPTALKLGGKNPVYIDASAHVEMATRRIIWGKCHSSGQTCVAPDYILCTKSVEKEFLRHAKSVLTSFGYHDSWCVVSKHHFTRITNLLTNLKIAIGGRFDSSKRLIEPTIAIDVDLNHPIMQEEIFGPILPIVTIESVTEAVDFINQREKPLALYVFTKKKSVKDYVLNNTSSGGVTVNDTIMHVMVESLPFGGVGMSGTGSYKNKDSFDTFTHRKSVLVKNTWKIGEKINCLRYPPYSRKKTNFGSFLMQYRRGVSWIWVTFLGIFLLVCSGLLCVFLLSERTIK